MGASPLEPCILSTRSTCVTLEAEGPPGVACSCPDLHLCSGPRGLTFPPAQSRRPPAVLMSAWCREPASREEAVRVRAVPPTALPKMLPGGARC